MNSKAACSSHQIVNALTVDVEDYFQVSALAPYIPRSDWDNRPCRVERNLDLILAMLNERSARATFFTLGWIAERYPQLVRRIVSQGHELASHGYSHERVSEQSPQAFLADIRVAKAVLEEVGSVKISGYRAPSFSISERTPWAADCIFEAGYRYSSSIYPIRHDHYGVPNAPRFAYEVCPGLLELPVTTARIFQRNWPAGGGGYFRLLPYFLSKSLIRRVNGKDGKSAIFYFHPWELDPEQPRVSGVTAKTRFRHYLNLHQMTRRLDYLLRDFLWDRVDRIYLEASST